MHENEIDCSFAEFDRENLYIPSDMHLQQNDIMCTADKAKLCRAMVNVFFVAKQKLLTIVAVDTKQDNHNITW